VTPVESPTIFPRVAKTDLSRRRRHAMTETGIVHELVAAPLGLDR
jgi:hypothetical protein